MTKKESNDNFTIQTLITAYKAMYFWQQCPQIGIFVSKLATLPTLYLAQVCF